MNQMAQKHVDVGEVFRVLGVIAGLVISAVMIAGLVVIAAIMGFTLVQAMWNLIL